DSEFVADALAQHQKLLSWMADSLARGPYLAGESFSNAECAVIPYVLRLELLKLDGLWAQYPAIADWWARMRARPSVKSAIFDRMKDNDWAPFRTSRPIPGLRCRSWFARRRDCANSAQSGRFGMSERDYGAPRRLRGPRKRIHLGVSSPNSPASQSMKPANARTAISPNIRSKSTTHVD
ncbi:MAG: glutathione S-transferase family protein, partial [Xanthobacteraceae bacterium]